MRTLTHTPVNSNTQKKRILVRTKVITNSNSKSLQQTINHRQTLAQTLSGTRDNWWRCFSLDPHFTTVTKVEKFDLTHTHLRRLQRPKTIRKHERKTIPHTHTYTMDRLPMENKHLYVEKKGREVVVVVSLLKTNKKAYSSLNSRIQNRKKKLEKKVRNPSIVSMVLCFGSGKHF